MAKNKGKNKGGKTQQQPKNSAPVQKITPEIKENAASIEAKITELEDSNTVPAEVKTELSSESATKFETAERKEDVAGYLRYLRELNQRIDAQLARANTMVEEAKAEKESLAEEKKEFEKEQKQFKTDRADLDKKDIALKKRAQELENGEYSEIIHTLLESLEESQAKVLKETQDRIDEISVLHTKTMDAILQNQKDLSKLEEEKVSIQKQIRELKREKISFELEKSSLKADTEEEFQAKYQSEMQVLKDELERTKSKNSRLEKESDNLKSMLDKIRAAFDNESPDDMVQLIASYKEQVQQLMQELENRPAQSIFEQQQEKIIRLNNRISELESQVNEKEIGELRIKLANEDNFSMERMRLKSEIESAKVREDHNLRQIKTLEETINLLKEDKSKSGEAFEFAKTADHEPRFTQITFPRKDINDLPSFVTYIQGRMIDSKTDNGESTSFYYDNKTIRIFLAGLHMSPISILQGISGTGKTSLPREFAKALIAADDYRGISDEDKAPNAPYRICAIQSGWRDNMDLMGYYNSFDKKYKETDFFKSLYLANLPKYRNTLFFIILDEMNLSRPEHYFADFLSLLEQSEDERYIAINNTPAEALPEGIVGGKLRVPKNVRFIGTANHDETTLEFAPKTYDRSNLMEMPKNISREGQAVKAQYNISYSWLEGQFMAAEKAYVAECAKFKKFIGSKDFKDLIDEKNIGIGNRFERQADRFISVFLASGRDKKEDLAVAADHLITSRLFRTLKNRYDLDKQNLQNFRENFEILFEAEFGKKPEFANKMLDYEISCK